MKLFKNYPKSSNIDRNKIISIDEISNYNDCEIKGFIMGYILECGYYNQKTFGSYYS